MNYIASSNSRKVQCAYEINKPESELAVSIGKRTIHFGDLRSTVTAKNWDVTTLSDRVLGFIFGLIPLARWLCIG